MKIPHIQHIGLGNRNIGLRFARYAEYDMFYTNMKKNGQMFTKMDYLN